jgi:hypothetical protein
MSALETLGVINDREERRGNDETDPGSRGAKSYEGVSFCDQLELVVDVSEVFLDAFEHRRQRGDQQACLVVQRRRLEPIEKVVRRTRRQQRAFCACQSAYGHDVLGSHLHQRLSHAELLA